MPQPTASSVHVNAPLTQISIAFLQSQDRFIARKVFPEVRVKKQSDRYFLYEKKQWFRSDARERAPGTESAGSGFTIDNTPNYFATVWALHTDVDDQTRANADAPIQPDRDATEFVTRGILMRQELEWKARYFTTSVWIGSTTGGDITPGILWSSGGSTPIEDIRAQIIAVDIKTGFTPNKLILGAEVWSVLQDHPDFQERIKYTQTGILTTGLLAAILEIDEVLVAKAIEDTADEGATASHSYIFGKDALLVYAAKSPGIKTPSGGYTFAWTGLFGSNASGMTISRFRMEQLKSDRIEGEAAYDQKLVAAEMGAFFSAVVA